MKLKVNQIIKPVLSNSPLEVPHRILWLSHKTSEIVLYRVEKPYRMPFFTDLEKVTQWLKNGLMAKGEFKVPGWMTCPEEDIPQSYKDIRDDRWVLIEPIVSNQNRSAIFDSALRGQLIRLQAKITKKKREYFYPLLSKYWLYGQFINALLPEYPRCATNKSLLITYKDGKEDSRKNGKKRGAPRKVFVAGHDLNAIGVNVTFSDLKIFYKCIRAHYLRAGNTLSDTYETMIEDNYSKKVLREGEIFKIPVPENQKIQLGTFRYWVKKLLEDFSLLREVMDGTFWGKFFRGKPGRAPDTTIGPADIFEIDATPDNCYLVASYYRHHLIGRLVVYYVVDRRTTMITGLHTALEGPSWNAARFALYNAFSDKVAYCKRYGIDISPEDWPSQETCDLLVADQAEILSKNSRHSLQNMLHIDTEINAVGQADNKGTVESTNIKISERISWTAGAWKARANKFELEKDRKKLLDEACLTIEERTNIIIYEVLEHNNNVRVEYLLTDEMIKDRIKPYRRDIYLWSLENETGEPRRISDKTQLYRCLLPQEKTAITERGIVFKKVLVYLPEDKDFELLLAKARKRRIPIKIHYDVNSTNFVYQYEQETGQWLRWRLIDSCWEKYGNKRLEDVLEYIATQEFEAYDAKDTEAEHRAITRQKQKKVDQNARREKKKSSPPPSKSAYYKGTKQNRAVEREVERAKLVQSTPGADSPNKLTDKTKETGSSNIIDLATARLNRWAKAVSKRKPK